MSWLVQPGTRNRWRVPLAAGLLLCAWTAVAAETDARSTLDGQMTATAHKHLTGPVSAGIGATAPLSPPWPGKSPSSHA
jgi:hypothetical protein